MPREWDVGRFDTGLMRSKIFFKHTYLLPTTNLFHTWLPENFIQLPTILF